MGGIERFFKSECKSNSAEFKRKLSENFEAVVFSFANMVAPPVKGKEESLKQHFGRLSEIVRQINVPLFVFGVGMQERLTAKEDILPELSEFLLELNQKAEIFGCRGAETEAYLRHIGCDRALALGCPSLYVYPSRVRSINALSEVKNKTGTTAGYLDRRHLIGYQPERILSLEKITNKLNLSYVFQNDLMTLSELENVHGIYSDADNSVDSEIINSYIESFGVQVSVKEYRFFRDPRAWRQYASHHDFFFGDRFHGGVVSLQTGRPALFIYNDLRVRELTEHFGIPSVSLKDVLDGDVEDIVVNAFSKTRTAQMRDIYDERVKEYFEIARKVGLLAIEGVSPKKAATLKGEKELLDSLSKLMPGPDLEGKLRGSIRLAVLGRWALASVERLIIILSELQQSEKILEVIQFIVEMTDLAPLDEALIYRIGRLLVRSKADLSCELLLRGFLQQSKAPWTERNLLTLIDVQLRTGNALAARQFFVEAQDRNCLNPELVRRLNLRINQALPTS